MASSLHVRRQANEAPAVAESLKKTTVSTPPELWRELKHLAIQQDMTMRELVTVALRQYAEKHR